MANKISLPFPFDPLFAGSMDARSTVADAAGLEALRVSAVAYPGMQVTQVDTNQLWVLSSDKSQWVIAGTTTPEWNDIQNKPVTFPATAHNHTSAEITDLNTTIQTAVDAGVATVTTTSIGAIPTSEKGAVSGVATLDASGNVTATQLAGHITNDHTIAGISGLQTALDTKANDGDVTSALATKADASVLTNYVLNSEKAAASGIATLDSEGKIPLAQLRAELLGAPTRVVADIAARDALAPTVVTWAVVTNPAADPTVTSGSAVYVYDPTTTSWSKMAEVESMDVVLDWANVQNVPTTFAPSAHNHTTSEITDYDAATQAIANAAAAAAAAPKIDSTEKAAANGVATLGADGQVPASQLGNADAAGTATSAVSAHSSAANAHEISGVNGLQTALDAKIDKTSIGVASGVVPLGADGKVADTFLPDAIVNADVIDKLEANLTVAGVSLGGYNSGDTIPSGTELRTIIMNMLRKRIAPTYVAPTLTAALSNAGTLVEVGTSVAPTITPTWVQNNAGLLTACRILQGAATIHNDSAATAYNVAAFNAPLGLTTFTSEVDYAEGAVLNDNFGDASPAGHIAAGTVVSNSVSVRGAYRVFYGLSGTYANSANIRALANSALNPANGSSFGSLAATNATNVVIAYPATLRNLTNATLVSAGFTFDITSEIVSQGTVDVNDAAGTAVSYKVFTYTPAVAFSGDVTFTI